MHTLLVELSFGSLLLAAGLCAQQAPRKAAPPGMLTRGEVLAADGSPWAGVRVTFAARPWLEAPVLDRRECESDARGRFRLRLHPNLEYHVWAMRDPDETGVYRSTRVITCRAGTRIKLRELSSPSKLRRVLLPAVQAVPYEKMRVEVADAHIDFKDVRPDGPNVDLPAFPGRALTLRVRDANGVRIVNERVSMTARGRKVTTTAAKATARAPAPPAGPRASVQLAVEKRYATTLLFRILDKDKKGIPGARLTVVDMQLRPLERIAAVSDAEGWLRFENRSAYARGPSMNVLNCFVDAPGFVRGRLDVMNQIVAKGTNIAAFGRGYPVFEVGRDVDALRKAGKADSTWTLRRGHKVAGRLMIDGERPAAFVPLRCRFSLQRVNPNTTSGYDNKDWDLQTRTNADGSFRFDGVEDDYAVYALLPTETRRAIGAESAHPQALIASGEASDAVALGVVRLDALQRSRLRIRTPGGEAARFARVIFATEDGDTALACTLDRLGRIEAIFPKRGRYRVACRAGAGEIERVFELEAGVRDITLERTRVVTGKVTSGDGKILAGAKVSLRVWSLGGADESLLGRLKTPEVKTDAKGVYRLPIPRGGGRANLNVSYQHGKRWHTNHRKMNLHTLQFGQDRYGEGSDVEHDVVLDTVKGPLDEKAKPAKQAVLKAARSRR